MGDSKHGADGDTGRPRTPPSAGSPSLLVFDVNETLSDMSGMVGRFAAAGAPAQLAGTWFAALLRDGFALTVNGVNPDFAELARTSLGTTLAAAGVDGVDAAVHQLMQDFTSLPVHEDVVEGISGLASAGFRLVTLSNGSTAVAQGLFERNDLTEHFERLLSVQDAAAWKPDRAAYEYALDECGVQAGEAMLVAVHPWDIHGARAAGLRTAFVNRKGVSYPGYFDPPELEAGSLTELAEILRGAR